MNPTVLTSTPGSLAGILGDVTSIIGDATSGAIKWISDFAGVITSNPIIEVFVLMGAVGLGVGLLRRLISVN